MVVDAPETRIVNTFRVSCDGGGEPWPPKGLASNSMDKMGRVPLL